MQLEQAIVQVKNHNIKHKLFEQHNRVLLAVSGGRDSMCMLALFEQLDQPFGVAHMNYQLRGDESDKDAAFVEDYCQQRGIGYHLQRVDCREYMAEQGKGLQQAARDLRYTWMMSLLEEGKYHAIATAHHQDDSVETLLINLMRGTGIQGLTGIPVKRKGVVRPMMCFSSQEIHSITESQLVPFREDSSNLKDDYLRNRIRHHLIPLMNEIKPGSSQNLIHDIERIKGQWEALEALSVPALAELTKSLTEFGGSLEIRGFKNFPSSKYLLARITRQYGFTVQECANILQSDKTAGIGVQSSTHEMILDRELIRISRIDTSTASTVQVGVGETAQCGEGILEIKRVRRPDTFSNDPNIEYLAVHSFPKRGIVRSWMAGDRFSPIGMHGSQKVSDLLTNLKYSTFEKRKVNVLVSEDQIAWVIGIRLSEDFKVSDKDKEVIQVVWTPDPAQII